MTGLSRRMFFVFIIFINR